MSVIHRDELLRLLTYIGVKPVVTVGDVPICDSDGVPLIATPLRSYQTAEGRSYSKAVAAEILHEKITLFERVLSEKASSVELASSFGKVSDLTMLRTYQTNSLGFNYQLTLNVVDQPLHQRHCFMLRAEIERLLPDIIAKGS